MCQLSQHILYNIQSLLSKIYTQIAQIPLMEIPTNFSSTTCLLYLMDYVPHPILLCLIFLSSLLLAVILLLTASVIVMFAGWLYFSAVSRLISLNFRLYHYFTGITPPRTYIPLPITFETPSPSQVSLESSPPTHTSVDTPSDFSRNHRSTNDNHISI